MNLRPKLRIVSNLPEKKSTPCVSLLKPSDRAINCTDLGQRAAIHPQSTFKPRKTPLLTEWMAAVQLAKAMKGEGGV